MKLKHLLKEIPAIIIKGSKELEITGITAHSKSTIPGNLFISKAGQNRQQFLQEALQAGAIAIITDLYDPFLKNITQIITEDIAELEILLASRYYRFPSQQLLMIGVTGTSGKTTTTFLIRQFLEMIGLSCGLIGTIQYIAGQQRYTPSHTTPDLLTNQKLLREMVEQGCKAAVMEVSSHGIAQNRVKDIEFDIAIFTNLSHDHLDYHGSMQNYGETKAQLFTQLFAKKIEKKWPKKAIVNVDDAAYKIILKDCQSEVMTYGINHFADVCAKNIALHVEGCSFDLCHADMQIRVDLKLIGLPNIYNVLAAICVLLTIGYPLATIIKHLAQLQPVEGRLEKVPNELGVHIYVDYAHKPDALEKVLLALNAIKKNRIITVFGCGGNRDAMKRPLMAQISERLSNFSIITSDNPRSEDPQQICQEIEKGFNATAHYSIEPDRRKAIELALQMSQPEDIILIAGKGHENYQIFAGKTIEFDDRDVATELCQQVKQETMLKA